jgi:hypothetical protein
MPHDEIPNDVRARVEKAISVNDRLRLDANARPGRLVLTIQSDSELVKSLDKDLLEGPDYPPLSELGITCLLVGQPLEIPGVGLFAGHLFVVAGAQIIGDSNATVYSFGQAATKLVRPSDPAEDFLGMVLRDSTENMMGRVGPEGSPFPAGDFSEDTSLGDVRFWNKLTHRKTPGDQVFLPREVTPFFASEAEVRWYAENVVHNYVYQLLPDSGYGSNSNAAAQAVANRSSQQGDVPLPGGAAGLSYPGAENWAEVTFANTMP